ncbi:hypothetical protein KDA08_05795 [Candidatus Saccharibacteria bacterium]|nr:hypothetical protein [Candidatus Saccharibacteria bacterium]
MAVTSVSIPSGTLALAGGALSLTRTVAIAAGLLALAGSPPVVAHIIIFGQSGDLALSASAPSISIAGKTTKVPVGATADYISKRVQFSPSTDQEIHAFATGEIAAHLTETEFDTPTHLGVGSSQVALSSKEIKDNYIEFYGVIPPGTATGVIENISLFNSVGTLYKQFTLGNFTKGVNDSLAVKILAEYTGT